MSYRDTYDFWMTDDYFDEDTKKELVAIACLLYTSDAADE